MTKISPVLYTDNYTQPSYFLKLDEDYGGPVLRIVDKDGHTADCGNLLSLTSEGVNLRPCVSTSVAEAAGLPASMFEDGTLRVVDYKRDTPLDRAVRHGRVSEGPIVHEKFECRMDHEDKLILTPRYDDGLFFDFKDDARTKTIGLSSVDVERLRDRLTDHLEATT